MEKKLSLKTKFAYASTDLASNLMWATASSYLMYFYTDVAGIAIGTVATLFLIVRIFDAFVDPFVGITIDKTDSKYGKSRPYFLWMAAPFAIFLPLTFISPNWSDGGKLAYAYITYIILGIVYSFINIPVTSILPRLTVDPKQRNTLGAFRMLGAIIGAMFVSIATLPIVNALGGGKTAAQQKIGFAKIGVIYGIVGALLFVFAFFNLKEHVDIKNEKQSVSESLKALKGNWPWLIVFVLFIFEKISNTLRMSNFLYFLKYNIGRPDLIPAMSSLGLIAICVVIIIAPIANKFGKRNTLIYANAISVIGYVLLYIFGEKSIPMLFISNAIITFGLAFSGLLFVMTSDTIDYGEWKNGVRADGILSAATSFGQKFGSGLGGWLAGFILAIGGYNGMEAVQTTSALSAIKNTYIIIPLILSVLSILVLIFYKVDKVYPQMMIELEEKRKNKFAQEV